MEQVDLVVKTEDFTRQTYQQQMEAVRGSHILIGMHGAGEPRVRAGGRARVRVSARLRL